VSFGLVDDIIRGVYICSNQLQNANRCVDADWATAALHKAVLSDRGRCDQIYLLSFMHRPLSSTNSFPAITPGQGRLSWQISLHHTKGSPPPQQGLMFPGRSMSSSLVRGLTTIRLTFPDLCAALSIDNSNRAALVTAILSDIKSCEAGGANGRLQHTGTQCHPCFLTINKSLFLRCSSRSLGHQGSGSSSVRIDCHSVGQ
jgi:hypothetical protein